MTVNKRLLYRLWNGLRVKAFPSVLIIATTFSHCIEDKAGVPIVRPPYQWTIKFVVGRHVLTPTLTLLAHPDD